MKWSQVVAVVTGVLLVVAAPVFSQENATDPAVDRIQQIAQMPVAVDKVVYEAGVDPLEVARVAHSLHEGGVDPIAFNGTMHDMARVQAARLPEGLDGITGVGHYVTGKLQDGLRGEALAQAVRNHLRSEFGIPAGGHEDVGPPPVAQNFIPAEAREAAQRQRAEEARGRRGPADRPGRATQPGPSTNVGGPPGGVGGPPGGAGRP